MVKKILFTIPVTLLLLVGVFFAFTFAMGEEKMVKSPDPKIDDALWNELKDVDQPSMKVQSSVRTMRARSAPVEEDYQIIVSYNVKKNVHFEAINADATSATYSDIMALAKDPEVEKIYLDQEIEMDLNKGVPFIGAKTQGYDGGAGVKVCILDTGMDKTHPALKLPYKEFDFVNNDPDASDDSFGHGTHVAGIVASSDQNYKGVAPQSDLLIAKVFNANGRAMYSHIFQGIAWCVENDADIISMSGSGMPYEGECDFDIMAQVANWAVDQGVVFVGSAGNVGKAGGGAPACASKTISVGATDNKRGRLHSWSSKNGAVDVTATGDITSTIPNGQFREYHGTSMACPMVSGSVALLKGLFPESSPAEVKEALEETATCYRSRRCEFGEGNGLINAYEACLYLEHNGEIPTTQVQRTTYGSNGQTAWATIGGTTEMNPSCLSYISDDQYFAVSEDHETYYPAVKRCRERTKYNRTTRTRETYTYCTERSSYSQPKNVMFVTEEGYPVEIRGRKGRYTYYVWYDTDVDKQARNKAKAWVYVPLNSRDTYVAPVENAVKSPNCGACSQLFSASGVLP